ncbi:phosphoribosylglycinamide formyltransferase [Dinghuibacter silviterrae]|uniref:phosphoribosylglycinamide formyltransferase 1 n=1 Tax=Dinghuibacter silviterrae TaxID=1539049 RepID=A0A4V6Q9Y5_9BACT|nr:phosphoribosylglycinamide formyltransferase [Dinghuibacter silviterrae]TDW99652.1 phosphoribosylglycinamide formyltransferase-1 [Dinghuibacter silviterrae]
MINIAIFASGSGTNAQKIIDHFRDHPRIRVSLVVCNKPGAGVLAIAAAASIDTLLIERDRFFRGDTYLPELIDHQIAWIILAGFLWKVPAPLIAAFPSHIINIHPALLPKYGGKGMYGHFVHEAVVAAGDPVSGITIHLVDEQYDHGTHLFQATCDLTPEDTPATVAAKVLALEHRYFPEVIEKTVLG